MQGRLVGKIFISTRKKLGIIQKKEHEKMKEWKLGSK